MPVVDTDAWYRLPLYTMEIHGDTCLYTVSSRNDYGKLLIKIAKYRNSL